MILLIVSSPKLLQGLQKTTKDYKRLQKITKDYKRLQNESRNCLVWVDSLSRLDFIIKWTKTQKIIDTLVESVEFCSQ